MKPFDISKFKKSITKALPGISTGFHDPKTWISTGSYVLNKLISNDFKKGIPLGKSTIFAGESGCLPATSTVKIKFMESLEENTVTIAELKQMWMNRFTTPFWIDTPDGYQQIGQWFNKGILPMVEVKAVDNYGFEYVTVCADNHLIQNTDRSWTMAYNLKVNDNVLTKTINAKVTSVKSVEPQECFDFEILHENHRYFGDGFVSHNSGKSLICSGTVIKNAQDMGIFVVLVDTENALDESWLHNFGVDTSESKLLKLNMAMVDDVAKTISDFMIWYKDEQAPKPEEERQKILFVIDSLGMLMTPTDVAQFQSGEMKGDMGRKPKALKALVTNVTNMFGQYDVGLLCTNHTYASQDMYNPDPKVSGGCLVAGTKIKMKGGVVKAIEDVRIGDWVQTYMGDKQVTNDSIGDESLRLIGHTYFKPCYKLTFGDGSVVVCSEDHKFADHDSFSNKTGIHWKKAKDIFEEVKKVVSPHGYPRFSAITGQLTPAATRCETSGLILSKIEKVEDQEVFDISVKDAVSYILADNDLLSHNSGPTYAASIVVVLQKRKLKEDEDGNKVSEVNGIRSAVMVDKSRYAKPFEKCELKIPYDKGMSPYAGMFEFLEGRGILEKIGNRYQYIDNDGVVHLHFRKNIPESLYDIIMDEWAGRQIDPVVPEDDDHDTIEVTTSHD